MHHLYEGMFLLDNNVVRQGWKAAKAVVTELLAKQGANVQTARRWDERKLAYPVKGRGRATYLLAYFELAADSGEALNRALELNEVVLRYLVTRVEAVPSAENELSAREQADDFVVPAPPVEEERRHGGGFEESSEEGKPKEGKAQDDKAPEGESTEGDEKKESEGESSPEKASDAGGDAPEKVAAGSGSEEREGEGA